MPSSLACRSALYVVATPIGNPDDWSPHAQRILSQVDAIACEDTRHSGRLLNYFGIQRPLLAYHDHNEQTRTPELIARLQQGEAIALISDAGTPLVSDPGFRLVQAAHAAEIPVIPIVGCCAAIAALSVAGLPSDRFSFEGFLPAKSHARCQRLTALVDDSRTLIFYESPHRIVDCLTDLVQVFGANRRIAFCRELTKTFETVRQGDIADILTWVTADPNQQKGEIVLVIAGQRELEASTEDALTIKLLQRLLVDLPVKQAAQIAADVLELKKNELYELALSLKVEK